MNELLNLIPPSHPLFLTVKELIDYFTSGECDFAKLECGLDFFNSGFVTDRQRWVQQLGDELESFIEAVSFLVITYFMSDRQLSLQCIDSLNTFLDDSSRLQIFHEHTSDKRRPNFPRQVIETLENWLASHMSFPYPNAEEKKTLCQKTGLSMKQLNDWFINARRRKLQ